MKLRLTPRASRDLAGIAEYLLPRSPRGARNVRRALLDAFDLARRHPGSGRLQSAANTRKLVSRYGYLVYYSVDPTMQEIVVLTIQHPARTRPSQDA